jgi:hypothetical protein
LRLLLDTSNVEKVKSRPSKSAEVQQVDLPIKAVQGYLMSLNLLWPGEDSGTLDSNTVAAIKDFQRAAQGIAASKGLTLTPSGVLDADTNKALIDGAVLNMVASTVASNPSGIGDDSGKVVPWSKTARKAPEASQSTAAPKVAPAAKTTTSTSAAKTTTSTPAPRATTSTPRPTPSAPATAPAATAPAAAIPAPATAPATAPAAAAVAAPVAAATAAATAAAVAQPAQASVPRRRGLFERPAAGEPTDALTEAIPYVAAGAGIMLLAGLFMGRDR